MSSIKRVRDGIVDFNKRFIKSLETINDRLEQEDNDIELIKKLAIYLGAVNIFSKTAVTKLGEFANDYNKNQKSQKR